MIKTEKQRESICFDFGKDEQKQNFFDKAKKCDIIRNNNSVFLHKILSVKNQSLLEYTLKKSESELLNSSTIESKKLINKNSSNRSLHRNNTVTIKENALTTLLTELNFNNPQNNSMFKENIFSPEISSPKIIVNKNKNLGNFIQKEKDKEKNKENENLYLNTYFNKDNTINNKPKPKQENQNLNNEYFINPEINFSNLYTSKYLRKPVVIKFNNNINPINISNNNINNSCNSAKKIDFSMTFNPKEENKENNYHKERIKTDERIKPYNFYEKNQMKPELYRSFEKLKKKSKEISRRKMKKNSSTKNPIFKKNINLEDVKESLDNFIQKSKSKKKIQIIKKDKKGKVINKTRSLKNVRVIINKNVSTSSLRLKEIENEKNDFHINKENIDINKLWQEPKKFHYNLNDNIDNINENKFDNNNINIKSLNFQNISKIKSEKVLSDENKDKKEHNFCINKKNININFIEDHKSENIYNISLNNNELFNNFNNNLIGYNHNTHDKNSFIRRKYGKKYNMNKVFEDCKNHIKNVRRENGRDNKSPIVTKKFIEDYKINDNISLLSYSQSQSYLSKRSNGKQIKVNKKSNSSHKKNNEKRKALPSILEEEEKIKNEIKNNLNVINGIEALNNFITTKNKNILKEKFEILVDYSNQMKTINNNTLLTNISQNTGLKYVKKIIPAKFSRENISKINNHYHQHSKTNFSKKNYFNIEKQKLIILKRKEFGFFERYEHCVDFIENIRMDLIKYILMKKKENK